MSQALIKPLPLTWIPVGVTALEPTALKVVRATGNTLVIAGPGAGKTELLAQRACYLLQTRICRTPKRILAISFKRDAARNLQERVIERCGSELGRRFDSMTFDAFAKGLIDRFRLAVPEAWRPKDNYQLNFQLSEANARKWLEQIPLALGGFTTAQLAGLQAERMYRTDFIGGPLALTPAQSSILSQQASRALWNYALNQGETSVVNFQMIGRLAELLLRANPLILRALRATYSFVFLDEFQDTTGIQYDLAATAFLGSDAEVTAVGDNKQRIMGWAGALDGVFAKYENDFKAAVARLHNNYRSAPELVRILAHLTKAIDKDAAVPIAVDDGSSGAGECRVLLFEDHLHEARYIATLISEWLQSEGLGPRDVCVLTRNRPADYTQALRRSLEEHGVEARIESELQDLLAEPITSILLNVLTISSFSQAPEARTALLDLLLEWTGCDQDASSRQAERSLDQYANALRPRLNALTKEPEAITELLTSVVAFLGRDRIDAAFPQYSQGTYLNDTVNALAKALFTYLEKLTWPQAIEALQGGSSVPIMTMHKSKGLEYHTVIFVGLEDSALWTFSNREEEETCGFFVAFSRARKRVLFTFCDERPKYPDKPAVAQQRKSIGPLYDLLKSAGVTPERMGST